MARGPPPPPQFTNEITQLSFFFGDFRNSDEAAAFVIANNRGTGTFLLRPSTRNPGTLTLTISIDGSHARHVNVHQKTDDNSETGFIFYIIPERVFTSFHNLYAFYTANVISNLEQVNNVRLLNPLTRVQVHTPEPPVPQRLSASSNITPVVSSNEIPPLPRKTSMSGADGGSPLQDSGERLSHNSFGQPGLPELPPIERRTETSSLDSQGNEIQRTSGSSNGSGTISVNPTRDTLVPRNYLATRYPTDARMSTSPPTNVSGHEGFGELTFSESGQFANETSLLPLTKKEQKEQRKQQKQAEKQRKKEEKKKKKGKSSAEEMNDLVKLGWCRPPMPLPDVNDMDEHPYYSTPRAYKNHLEELKRMLKESEICDCGLRMMDAELTDGWTVHRSRDSATFMRVFYQHENGNTTWVFPSSIVDFLSVKQVQFIVHLCQEGKQDIPAGILKRHKVIMHNATGSRHYLPSTSSATSSRSLSGSSSSEWNLSSSTNLDQRPPMAGPGGM